jgi:PAS domain S-box-containing protein
MPRAPRTGIGVPGRRSSGTRRPPAAVSSSALLELIEDSTEGMILADQTGLILYANPACERLLGRRPSELRGTNGFDMLAGDSLHRGREGFARALAERGEPIALRVEVTPPNGTPRLLDVRLTNRLTQPGVSAVLVHFREAATPDDGQQEAHYRAVFESAPIGLGVAALDGTLLVFNRAMLEPGGYTVEDIQAIGNVARLYAHEVDRDRLLALARGQGFVWREAVQFVRKSGEPYDTLMSLAPVQFGGRRCWLAAVEDVTEQRRAEEQQRQLEARLRQAQKMEAVGRMTAGIAHDFNNVLSVIMASSDLIAHALGREAAAANEDLAELRRAATRGVTMVSRLLGYSRSANLVLERTDLTQLIWGLQGMLRRLVPYRITVDLAAEPGCEVMVDPAAVEQMVTNLVTNARDAIPGGGTIRVEVSGVMHDGPGPAWLPAGAYVQLAVSDTGTGMDAATRARATEPFFTTKPAGAGTGLGLSMVYGLAKQQGGFVDIESAPGAGTSVTLFFPRAQLAPRASAPPQAP